MKLVKVQDFYFYMKSGNKIFVDNIATGEDSFSYTYTGSEIKSIKDFLQIRPRYRLVLGAIALNQIEAIVADGYPRYKLVR